MRSSIRLGAADVLREVAGGVPGDIIRDRDAGAALAGHQQPQVEPVSCGRCRGGSSRRWSWCASCIAGFKRIDPGMDIGVDLGEVWWTAERLAEDAVGNDVASSFLRYALGHSISDVPSLKSKKTKIVSCFFAYLRVMSSRKACFKTIT